MLTKRCLKCSHLYEYSPPYYHHHHHQHIRWTTEWIFKNCSKCNIWCSLCRCHLFAVQTDGCVVLYHSGILNMFYFLSFYHFIFVQFENSMIWFFFSSSTFIHKKYSKWFHSFSFLHCWQAIKWLHVDNLIWLFYQKLSFWHKFHLIHKYTCE